jgi:hypothetical protein
MGRLRTVAVGATCFLLGVLLLAGMTLVPRRGARSGGPPADHRLTSPPQAPAAPAPAETPPAPRAAAVDFDRDVRPILSDNCFACHGPDQGRRKAGLRLDTREGLFGEGDEAVVVPGHPERSELFRRVTAQGAARMPPLKSGRKLSDRQVALLREWIERGAPWKGHWAYVRPVRPVPPAAEEPGFVRNPIDRFVLAGLRRAGQGHAAEADRVTLARRLYFDLLGLPPTWAQVQAFVNDPCPDAYERLVDRLLASPHFGERMALHWLDLVRYADTIGYYTDVPMPVAPYRDWVIRAFNANLPFDRFTCEQLAGDLLPPAPAPEAALWQKVASGYNRLLQTTEETGAQAREYEAKYAADRVRNLSTVWLGTTMGCCQCHDHKYDPFTARDFYRLAAFFADVHETVGKRDPGVPVPDGPQAAELRRLDDRIAELERALEREARTPRFVAAFAEWEKANTVAAEWQVLDPEALSASGGTTLTKLPGGAVLAGGVIPVEETYTVTARTDLKQITGFRLEVLSDPSLPAGGPGTGTHTLSFVLTELKVAAASGKQPARPVALRRATADWATPGFDIAGARDGNPYTGWSVAPRLRQDHLAIFEPVGPVRGEGVTTLTFTLEHRSQYPRCNIGKFRLAVTATPALAGGEALPGNVRGTLAIEPARRTAEHRKELLDYFQTVTPLVAPLHAGLSAWRKRRDELLRHVPTTLVTVSGPPRVVRALPRGNWMDESGPVVTPGVPRSLPPLRAAGPRATRLDLARWLVSRDNPLTARVVVNRLWKLFFGEGIARTPDDLGTRGEAPTHPELLDWLAVEFMESGWDVKHLVRLLVTSGTYRQSSRPTAELKRAGPGNRLLGRQSAFRLDAELVRDNALAVSGLLVRRLGGPSVKPYQPAGYWDALVPARRWRPDRGEGLYRRGLYTHWQRSFLHPGLLAFDAPPREECTAQRQRSDTPQQALVLLNDTTYVEAARALAQRALQEGGGQPAEQVAWAYRQVLSREPDAAEAQVLTELYSRNFERETRQGGGSAEQLLGVGDFPVPEDVDLIKLAALTAVARVLLNLKEAITRY